MNNNETTTNSIWDNVDVFAKEARNGQQYPVFEVFDYRDGVKVPLFGGSLSVTQDKDTGEVTKMEFNRVYVVGSISAFMNRLVTDGLYNAIKNHEYFKPASKPEGLPAWIMNIPEGPARDAAIKAFEDSVI